MQEQRRVIVLHTKKGRTHAHVVWERYDHKRGKVISDSFSRLAQDRARKEMERVFKHTPTPHRNQHRPELKETLTNLWNQTETGKEFVKAVHDSGYLLAEGVPRHPFMVVDENGRSFDLVRQLKGARIKEVRQRLRHEKLTPEKEAIELMRQKQEGSSDAKQSGQQRDQDKAQRTAAAFWNNKLETTAESAETQSQKKMKSLADSFIVLGQELTQPTDQNNGLETKKKPAGEYVLNADELTDKADDTIADEHTAQLADNRTETESDKIIKPQSDKSRQSQQRVVEQLVANREETSQLSTEPAKKRYQEKLKEFMQSEDELIEPEELLPEETLQRQQKVTQQPVEKEELTASQLTEEEAIQKLILEQKEIRERYQQRARKRTR